MAINPDEWPGGFDPERAMEELVTEGYFDAGRPEDEVVFKLTDAEIGDLSDEDRELFESQVLPLLILQFLNPGEFKREYAKRRGNDFLGPESNRPMPNN